MGKKKEVVEKVKKAAPRRLQHGMFNLSKSAKIMCLTAKDRGLDYRHLIRSFGEAEQNYHDAGRLVLKGS